MIINLPLTEADAHVLLRALAVACDHSDEERAARTWIAERLGKLVDPAYFGPSLLTKE
jgi:hypothetical protein